MGKIIIVVDILAGNVLKQNLADHATGVQDVI